MGEDSLFIRPIFEWGPVNLTTTVITTWVVMAIIGGFAWLATRRLQMSPARFQTLVEAVVSIIEESIRDIAPLHVQQILPFIGTLWVFIVIANLTGLIPGMHSPTRDLSATAAIAFLVFLSVHWYGIRLQGLKNYLVHYLKPSPILLPFNLISEVTRTIALAVRLFGNMMSLEMVALLVLMVAGFLAPVPILMLHIVEALVQAYIFGMLALIYVASGLQSQQLRQQKQGENHA
ncbi:MAG: F0F1 ATP synthase subunit A [Gammaproteobacteria bacterium]|nr:F0F1 ATP synthase subunit A [Gammaproteobacteria bacterium]